MTEKLRSYGGREDYDSREGYDEREASNMDESSASWSEAMERMADEFDEERAREARQAALDGIDRIEQRRQNEEYRQKESAIYEAREQHGNDPDYTHIYWARDGVLAVEMGGSEEELPIETAVEKYKDSPYFQAEYAYLTYPADEGEARIVDTNKNELEASVDGKSNISLSEGKS